MDEVFDLWFGSFPLIDISNPFRNNLPINNLCLTVLYGTELFAAVVTWISDITVAGLLLSSVIKDW